MDVAILFSGGKDSTMAVYAALNNGENVRYLLSIKSRNDESYMFHVPNIHITDLLAQAMDIHFKEDIVKRNLAILDSLSEDATTSLQRDIMNGKDSEIDGLIYEVVRLADRYNADLPIYKKIAAALKGV